LGSFAIVSAFSPQTPLDGLPDVWNNHPSNQAFTGLA
jgi:hypothetical protein